MPQEILRRVLTAPVYDVAEETPLELAPLISKRMQNQVWIKNSAASDRVFRAVSVALI